MTDEELRGERRKDEGPTDEEELADDELTGGLTEAKEWRAGGGMTKRGTDDEPVDEELTGDELTGNELPDDELTEGPAEELTDEGPTGKGTTGKVLTDGESTEAKKRRIGGEMTRVLNSAIP